MLIGVFLIAIADGSSEPTERMVFITATPNVTQMPAMTATPIVAGREPIQLPENYRDTLVQYAVVTRSDGIYRNLYISPEAVEAVANGEPLPDRTIVLIEAFDVENNVADPEIHLAEARSTWEIADLAASSRVGRWNFGAFDARDGSIFAETGLNDCFSCHEGASNRNFIFSNSLLEAFIREGEIQESYCPRPGRAPCR